MSKKVLYNYFDLRELIKLYTAIAEKDPEIAPLFYDLNGGIKKDEYVVAKQDNRTVFSRKKLSPLVKLRYGYVKDAFKKHYGVTLPEAQ